VKTLGFIVTCLVCALVAHDAAVIPHEFAHSFMAWALGHKSDPLVIRWGGTGLANLLLLLNIDEQVDYPTLFAHGDGLAVAIIGFVGPGLANGGMYLLSLLLLRLEAVRRRGLAFMLAFWFNFMNVGNFCCYVPIRTFEQTGNIGHIVQGLGISPWLALLVLGTPTALAMWFLFTRTLPDALVRLAPDSLFR
jgi:hypothetical protein